ncbi:MAG: hypothetical protein JO292_13840 [Betaproteobacteria bacterium]|nr:hypothetical protein [Betaproteobacteria bacterium]
MRMLPLPLPMVMSLAESGAGAGADDAAERAAGWALAEEFVDWLLSVAQPAKADAVATARARRTSFMVVLPFRG